MAFPALSQLVISPPVLSTMEAVRRFSGNITALSDAVPTNNVFLPLYVPKAFVVRGFGVYNGSILSGGNLSIMALFKTAFSNELGYGTPGQRMAYTEPFTRSGTNAWQWQTPIEEVEIGPGWYVVEYAQTDATSRVFGVSVNEPNGRFYDDQGSAGYPGASWGLALINRHVPACGIREFAS